ncbi:ATPase AAA [Thiomicrospira aerophila AL3]|uniref:ATPase AAA n=1 Tax=Thiomicrospira aerophila AL3 TaxID=717772 RepID=W0DY17_9GAMM|nr:AAA family ATPase [Thiomicrospira aerophila]AHF01746.1 ATPase AAA [Thiomicrospira aerophila AL3]
MIHSVVRQTSQFILQRSQPSYQRFLLSKIDFNDRLIGIKGARGSGKTTLLLQYAKQCGLPLSKVLYVSCDHPAMVDADLFELAMTFYQEGGKLLLLDESHKAKQLGASLKAIYDTFDLKVIFSGSSAIQMTHQSADLSRRAVIFHLPALSFREFLEIETGIQIKAFSLAELLKNHQDIALDLTAQFRPIEHFRAYTQHGAYPFYQESLNNYPLKLLEVINHTIDSDLTSIFHIDSSKLDKLKKMLYLLCATPPLELNKAKISAALEASWPTIDKYIQLMASADLIHHLRGGSGMRAVNKPNKLLLANPNLFYVLCAEPNSGSVRESFFVSQLSHQHQVHYHHQADFIIDEQAIFEIGGAGKTKKQLQSLDNSYLALDDIEVGDHNTIPLWMFGLLY